MISYSNRQRDGQIEVGGPGEEACTILIRPDSGSPLGLVIPAADVPATAKGIAEGMHQAAGLPVPIMLERPDLDTGKAPYVTLGGVTIGTTADGKVQCHADGDFDPAFARTVAGHLAACADLAEHDEAAAEVRPLAELIRWHLGKTDSVGIARAILTEREA